LEIEEVEDWHERMMELKDIPPVFKPIDVETYHERLYELVDEYHERLFEQNDEYVMLYRYIYGDFGNECPQSERLDTIITKDILETMGDLLL